MTAMTVVTHMLFNTCIFFLSDESLPATSSATPEIRAKPSEPIEPEDMEIITTSDTGR